jgi:hypothetical protein
VRAVALLALLAHGLYYAVEEVRERAALRELVRTHVRPTSDPVERLRRTTAVAFDIPPHRNVRVDYGITHPLLKALRPSAYTVFQHGGHCAKRSRLLVELLEVQGIRANKLYLYNPRGLVELTDPPRAWVHVVVEAEVAGRHAVADPLFNLVFLRRDGVPATAGDLGRDTTLLREWRLRADERFDVWEDALYTYDDVRRLPWFLLAGLGEPARGLLASLLGRERVDRWVEPDWLERPQLELSVMSFGAAGLIGLTFLRRKRRGRRGRR